MQVKIFHISNQTADNRHLEGEQELNQFIAKVKVKHVGQSSGAERNYLITCVTVWYEEQ